jgi:hypothetical protein
MTTIDPEVVLANLLLKNNSVSMKQLNELRVKIENKFNVYLDVSSNSLIGAVEYYPKLFQWNDETIIRKSDFDEQYVDNLINWKIPEEIRKFIVNSIREN